MRVLFTLGITALCVAMLEPVSAAGPPDRFVEFHTLDGETDIYDLDTVRMILPGRFRVTKTVVDDPQQITLKLKILDLLKPYCERPYGQYPLPQRLPSAIGTSLAGKIITVSDGMIFKIVYLTPVVRANDMSWLFYKMQDQPEILWYAEQHSKITNGFKVSTLFDCKRGLTNYKRSLADHLVDDDDEPSKVTMYPVERATQMEQEYLRVCRAVTQEAPYAPK
jgi:hypothetical protein